MKYVYHALLIQSLKRHDDNNHARVYATAGSCSPITIIIIINVISDFFVLLFYFFMFMFCFCFF